MVPGAQPFPTIISLSCPMRARWEGVTGPRKEGGMYFLILQRRKLRLREAKPLVADQTDGSGRASPVPGLGCGTGP